jgi:predicted outer membrane protein
MPTIGTIRHGSTLIFGLALLLTTSRPLAFDKTALLSAVHLTAQAGIEAGALAQSRAVSPEIRNLGRLVVHDNTDLDGRLLALAASEGIHLADGPRLGTEQLAELRGAQGTAFDRLFLNFNYGACEALRKQMRDAAAQLGRSPFAEIVALFDPIVQQDQFLSGWCLGHCVPRTSQSKPSQPKPSQTKP